MKQLLIFLLLLFTVNSIAQPLPKTDFDRWEETTYGSKPPKTVDQRPTIVIKDTKITNSYTQSYIDNSSYSTGTNSHYIQTNPILNRTETYKQNGKSETYQQHNPITNTVDVYNSNNKRIGYYMYNPLLQRVEYVKVQ